MTRREELELDIKYHISHRDYLEKQYDEAISFLQHWEIRKEDVTQYLLDNEDILMKLQKELEELNENKQTI